MLHCVIIAAFQRSAANCRTQDSSSSGQGAHG
jgi:hypothetical protein